MSKQAKPVAGRANTQLDKQEFGAENYWLLEKSLYYPGNDCQGRSFLFAWMERELPGLAVICLVYPSHVAIAIALPKGQVQHDYPLHYDSREYLLAGPTDFGTEVGQVMSELVELKPQVIAL